MKTYEVGEKTSADENFPVASFLIAKKYRAPILAFYHFARAADDVADHPNLSAQEKIAQLDQFEATLLGESDAVTAALPLRQMLATYNLTPRHALDLLVAFRQDARKNRYANWTELLEYCAYSAAPVGRFVLDMHGENSATWLASDALCSALQIINHLQDCGQDYLRLDRVYIPQAALAQHGIDASALKGAVATPALRSCIAELAQQTQQLLLSPPLSAHVQNARLRLEVSVIERIAQKLLALLQLRNPLSERVHLSKWQMFATMAAATISHITSTHRQPIAAPITAEANR